jgi:hypothetical protein
VSQSCRAPGGDGVLAARHQEPPPKQPPQPASRPIPVAATGSQHGVGWSPEAVSGNVAESQSVAIVVSLIYLRTCA